MKTDLWMRVLMVTLGSFALGTDAFVVAGILPEIARDMHVTGAISGQLETIFSLTVAIGSPILVTFLGNIPPKRLILLSLALFIASNLLAAAAMNFGILLAARVFAACGVAIYTPVAAGLVVGFAPAETRGRALGLLGTGMTSSIVLGVPLGILIGTQFGWRFTFVFVSILALIALIGILVLVPEVAQSHEMSLSARLAFLRRPSLLVMLCNAVIWMIGGYTLYSYLGLILRNVTHLNSITASAVFLWFGLTSIIGNILGGYGTDRWGGTRTLAIGIIGGGCGLLLISLFSTSPLGIAIALGIWALAGWMLGAPQQHRLIGEAPQAIGVLLSLNGSAIYLGIGIGAAFGGLMLNYVPLSALGWIGSIWEVLALVVLAWSVQLVRSKKVEPTPEKTSSMSQV